MKTLDVREPLTFGFGSKDRSLWVSGSFAEAAKRGVSVATVHAMLERRELHHVSVSSAIRVVARPDGSESEVLTSKLMRKSSAGIFFQSLR